MATSASGIALVCMKSGLALVDSVKIDEYYSHKPKLCKKVNSDCIYIKVIVDDVHLLLVDTRQDGSSLFAVSRNIFHNFSHISNLIGHRNSISNI